MATTNDTHVVGMPAFEAAITDAEMEYLEKHAQDPELAVSRRIVLAMMARDKETIAGFIKGAPDAAIGVLEGLTGYYQHLSAVRDFTRKAILRMVVASADVERLACDEHTDDEVMAIFDDAIEIALSDIETDKEAA